MCSRVVSGQNKRTGAIKSQGYEVTLQTEGSKVSKIPLKGGISTKQAETESEL